MSSFQKTRIVFLGYLVLLIAVNFFLNVHWLLYLVPFLIFVIVVGFGSANLSWNFFCKTYTHPKVSDKLLALTFDDGPDPNTHIVLDVLKKYDIKATFFCIGHKIEKHPEVLERMVSEGHLIGNHSFTHSNIFPFFRTKIIKKEINRTSELISNFTDKPCELFRPPFGVMSPAIARAAMATGQKVIGWNHRSFDTTRKDAENLFKAISAKLKAGTVLLLHDDRAETGKMLDSILQHAKSLNFIFVDVQEIFKIKRS